MVWQENVDCIVMLTNCVEGNKVEENLLFKNNSENLIGTPKSKVYNLKPNPQNKYISLGLHIYINIKRIPNFKYD